MHILLKANWQNMPNSIPWSSLSCSGGSENQEAEDEFHRHAQASWVQRMFTSLFSDSALFNTREGRAGKVHNVTEYVYWKPRAWSTIHHNMDHRP